jgi:hypothetical protein
MALHCISFREILVRLVEESDAVLHYSLGIFLMPSGLFDRLERKNLMDSKKRKFQPTGNP